MSTSNATAAADLAKESRQTLYAGDKTTAAIGATLAIAHAVLALVDTVRAAVNSRHGRVKGAPNWCECGEKFVGPAELEYHLEAVTI